MKKVLITGVCGGMGGATAKLLSDSGYQVFGLDYTADCPAENIDYIQCDLTDENSVLNAFRSVSQRTDELDAVLHFAGRYDMNSLVEMAEEDFVRIFNVNLFGMYRVNKIFLPLLKKGSKIIMTSSELAPLDPLPYTGVYAVTKSAVEKYAFSLRMELNLLGISVSIIRPGAVNTGMLGASTASLDRLCAQTKLYKNNTARFHQIVDSVESKSVPPQKIALTAKKALESRKPKYVYNVNRNVLLKLLNALPDRLQVWIIKKILAPKKDKKE